MLKSMPRARWLVVLHDLAMVAAVWMACLLLLDPDARLLAPQALRQGIAVVLLQGVVMWAMGLYRGLWRFASLPDLANIIRSALLGTALLAAVAWLREGAASPDYRPWLLYPALLVLGLATPRLLYRYWKDHQLQRSPVGARRVLVLGGGAAGERALRALRSDPRLEPVGLVDDARSLGGARILGYPVLGGSEQIPRLAAQTAAQLLVIADPALQAADMRRVVALCDEAGLPFRIVPDEQHWLGEGELPLAEVSIEDLLGREPVSFDDAAVRAGLRGRGVLISGAGGSIGAELALQCAHAGVGRLVLLERGELALIEIARLLRERFPAIEVLPVLADCADPGACRQALSQPVDWVFHAAAYKHVPLLESQLREALRNNVLATRELVSACRAAGVRRFILISSDKAVRPANVLGASKRLAEKVCQRELAGSRTKLAIVRFGNVLDSSGSVVPLFRRQIAEGGPVTVTHPEVTRFFMTIPEACQLILQAASEEIEHEAVYALDMGEPVAIRELAEQMIRLAGKRPDLDIPVRYTGLRPGEKLHEQAFDPDESYRPTGHARVLRAECQPLDAATHDRTLQAIGEALAAGADAATLRVLLEDAVPEYTANADRPDP